MSQTAEEKVKKAAYMREYYARNREARLAKAAEYRAQNKEKLQEFFREHYLKNADEKKAKSREWAAKNKQRKTEIGRAYYEANKDAVLETGAKWKRDNRDKVNASNRARDRRVRHATPKWADRKAIRQIYLQAQHLGKEVDHIAPIKNDIVCGLHVPANLRLIDPIENRKKGNHFAA